MKKGHSALFMSQAKHNVYQYIYPSIGAWLRERNTYLEQGYYRIHNGFITNELDIRRIYLDYSRMKKPYEEINERFPFTSFTQVKNLTIEIDIGFEILASVLYSTSSLENTYAWKLQVLFELHQSNEIDAF
jgi:hypothetical protein